MEHIKNKINPYGSHLAFLRMIFKSFEIKSVLELGLGENSTPFFLDQGCNLVSIEQQDAGWLNKMIKIIGENDNWKKAFNPYPIKEAKAFQSEFDLVFVDGHHESRADDVNNFFHKSPLIVAHDFEKTKFYQWHKIKMPKDYRLFTYTENGKQTALFAHISVL